MRAKPPGDLEFVDTQGSWHPLLSIPFICNSDRLKAKPLRLALAAVPQSAATAD